MSKDVDVIAHGQEKTALVRKRLLLAKMMYKHGIEHSENADSLSRMLAMHHFHSAVEITLKCIVLHFGIRSEKTSDLIFETLWDLIDKWEPLTSQGKRLPLHESMKVLNLHRNVVQHEGEPPPDPVFERSKVYAQDFLRTVFREYFDTDYDELNERTLIHNKDIREALDIAASCLVEDAATHENCLRSATICRVTYEAVRSEVERYLTGDDLNPFFEVSSGLRDYEDIARPLHRLMERTNEICKWVTLLASGVDLAQAKRFDDLTPIVHFLRGGDYSAQIQPEVASKIGKDEAQWVLGFATRVFIKWQFLGFAMEWPPRLATCLKKIRNKTVDVDVIGPSFHLPNS